MLVLSAVLFLKVGWSLFCGQCSFLFPEFSSSDGRICSAASFIVQSLPLPLLSRVLLIVRSVNLFMLMSSLRLFKRNCYVKLLIVSRCLVILTLRSRITFIVSEFLEVKRMLAIWVEMWAHRRWRRKLMMFSWMWPVGCAWSMMVGMWRARTEAKCWLRWR